LVCGQVNTGLKFVNTLMAQFSSYQPQECYQQQPGPVYYTREQSPSPYPSLIQVQPPMSSIQLQQFRQQQQQKELSQNLSQSQDGNNTGSIGNFSSVQIQCDHSGFVADISALRQQVAVLSMENETLKETLARLTAAHRESQLQLQFYQQISPTPTPTPNPSQAMHPIAPHQPTLPIAPIQHPTPPVSDSVLPTIASTLSLKQRLLSFRHVRRLEGVDPHYVHTIFAGQDGKFYTSGTEGIKVRCGLVYWCCFTYLFFFFFSL
jgi:hypothetical protein